MNLDKRQTTKELLYDFLWWEERTKNEAYIEKVKALMDRDPLTQDFLKKLARYNPAKGKSQELRRIKNNLEGKWGVSIGITADLIHHQDPNDKYPTQRTGPFRIYLHGQQRKEPIMELISDGIKAEGKLLLQLDLKLLNKTTNTQKFVKDTVWDAVKRRLQEWKEPSNDLQEQNAVYRMKKKTIEQYLRWYDIHTREWLSFRIIALIEREERSKTGAGQRVLEKIKKMGRKLKLGKSVKGEDDVEKGVKTIFQLIHRKPYSREGAKPVMEAYDCPTHGNSCSPSCEYYKEWRSRFNRLYPKSLPNNLWSFKPKREDQWGEDEVDSGSNDPLDIFFRKRVHLLPPIHSSQD